jgi:hypothetical protein
LLQLLPLPIAISVIHSVITAIAIMAAVIILISILQAIVPSLRYSLKTIQTINTSSANGNSSDVGSISLHNKKQHFVKGLLMALEFESANAVLKLGLFASVATGMGSNNMPLISSFQIDSGNVNNFLFFVTVLSLRTVINQALKRFS